MILATAAVWRWNQGRVAGGTMYDCSRNAVCLVAGLLCISLPERVLPKGIPQLGARDVVLVSFAVDLILNRDDRLAIVNHTGD